jgi:hypothetical protein
VSDGQWIEVTNFERQPGSNVSDSWIPANGSEQVILSDSSILTDGSAIEVAPATGNHQEQVASSAHAPGPAKNRPKNTSVRVD